MTRAVDMDKVSDILREQTAIHIMPRFRQLASHEIMTKTSPTDLVTVADKDMERALIDILPNLLPGSIVLGEEGVSAGDISLDTLTDISRPVWVTDPVDGTHNFAHGKEEFCTMLALVVDGITQASWIYDPVNSTMFTAIKGEGAYRNDERLNLKPDSRTLPTLEGFAGLKYFRKEMRPHIQAQSSQVQKLSSLFCAGHEYMRMATGQADFSIYTKVMPWDHLAGQLIYQEGGGQHAQWSGQPYTPQTKFGGILSASSPEIWDEIHKLFLEKIIADYREK